MPIFPIQSRPGRPRADSARCALVEKEAGNARAALLSAHRNYANGSVSDQFAVSVEVRKHYYDKSNYFTWNSAAATAAHHPWTLKSRDSDNTP